MDLSSDTVNFILEDETITWQAYLCMLDQIEEYVLPHSFSEGVLHNLICLLEYAWQRFREMFNATMGYEFNPPGYIALIFGSWSPFLDYLRAVRKLACVPVYDSMSLSLIRNSLRLLPEWCDMIYQSISNLAGKSSDFTLLVSKIWFDALCLSRRRFYIEVRAFEAKTSPIFEV
jgi:hypothetical protein